MRISVKLMGVLKAKTPANSELNLPHLSTIEDALTALDIEMSRVNAVSINGTIERDLTRILEEDDTLIVLAPVGGG